jgi:hypothetical protein
MASFPKGRTAFIVIHGIGEQNPFETLDGFGRGMLKLFEKQGIDFKLAHKLRHHPSKWTESYLRITPKRGGKSAIDLHEVYWAYLTEGKISNAEMRDWLATTLAGTKKFFAENQQLIDQYEEASQIEQLTRINRNLWLAALVYPILSTTIKLLNPFERFGWSWIGSAKKWLGGLIDPYLTGYLGDVAIYTTTDRKSKFFNVRQRILKDSLEMIKGVLNDPEVERVILCGHSLGSVIAYDSLNRLQIEHSTPDLADKLPPEALAKLSGLVTFGSPLDKIAFFFREHAEKEQWLRRAILGQLHSFKSKQLDFNHMPYEVRDPVEPVLQNLPWVNYWDKLDPVSGPLNLYRIAPEDNVVLHLGKRWGEAHVGYWGDEGMYKDLVGRVLGVAGG